MHRQKKEKVEKDDGGGRTKKYKIFFPFPRGGSGVKEGENEKGLIRI